jgi:hypothetical protein
VDPVRINHPALIEEAVLLKPREHLNGAFQLDTKLFDLKPGAYRIEATLSTDALQRPSKKNVLPRFFAS